MDTELAIIMAPHRRHHQLGRKDCQALLSLLHLTLLSRVI
jgi:hypothetical protein